jgi:hypothetical protein
VYNPHQALYPSYVNPDAYQGELPSQRSDGNSHSRSPQGRSTIRHMDADILCADSQFTVSVTVCVWVIVPEVPVTVIV